MFSSFSFFFFGTTGENTARTLQRRAPGQEAKPPRHGSRSDREAVPAKSGITVRTCLASRQWGDEESEAKDLPQDSANMRDHLRTQAKYAERLCVGGASRGGVAAKVSKKWSDSGLPLPPVSMPTTNRLNVVQRGAAQHTFVPSPVAPWPTPGHPRSLPDCTHCRNG